jgi:hypothetical protein
MKTTIRQVVLGFLGLLMVGAVSIPSAYAYGGRHGGWGRPHYVARPYYHPSYRPCFRERSYVHYYPYRHFEQRVWRDNDPEWGFHIDSDGDFGFHADW